MTVVNLHLSAMLRDENIRHSTLSKGEAEEKCRQEVLIRTEERAETHKQGQKKSSKHEKVKGDLTITWWNVN